MRKANRRGKKRKREEEKDPNETMEEISMRQVYFAQRGIKHVYMYVYIYMGTQSHVQK